MTGTNALVFCGGGPTRIPIGEADLVIAADSGVIEGHRLGIHVDVLVGDLDSALPEQVAQVERAGGIVERHPVDKDATDLELALHAALDRGASEVLVAGGDAGRFDHLLGNALVLASPAFAGMRVDAVFGAARLHVVRSRREFDGDVGELVSLFALGGPARGVRTSGLRWVLDGQDLEPGSTLGISNGFAEPRAGVEAAGGVVLMARPGVAS